MAILTVPSTAYPTIQSAVNAAMPGDTVRVRKGVYRESVVIGSGKNRIRIVGDHDGKTILDGGNTLQVGISVIGSQQVTLEKLTARYYIVAGVALSTNDNVVEQSSFHHNGEEGIIVSSNASGNLIYRSSASHNGLDGIEVDGPNNFVIRCHSYHNSSNGISLKDNYNLALENNINQNGNYGIQVAGNTSYVIGNKVSGTDTGVDAGNMLSLFYGNEVKGGALSGFFLRDGFMRNVVLGNKVKGNTMEGMALTRDASQNRILENEVTKNQDGIRLSAGSVENVIDHNKIVKNKDVGLYFMSGADNNAARSNDITGQRRNIVNEGSGNVLDDNKTHNKKC